MRFFVVIPAGVHPWRSDTEARVSSSIAMMLRLLIALVILAGAACFNLAAEATRACPPEATKETEEPKSLGDMPEPEWELLLCEGDRKITRIRIKLSDMKSSPWGKWGIAGKNGLSFETTDRTILQAVTWALRHPMRVGVPGFFDRKILGAPYQVGHIEVISKAGTYVVGITWYGFVFGEKDYYLNREFFSWMLAKQLDDIVLEETGEHIPKKIFEVLSGELKIERAKQILKDYIRAHKGQWQLPG